MMMMMMKEARFFYAQMTMTIDDGLIGEFFFHFTLSFLFFSFDSKSVVQDEEKKKNIFFRLFLFDGENIVC